MSDWTFLAATIREITRKQNANWVINFQQYPGPNIKDKRDITRENVLLLANKDKRRTQLSDKQVTTCLIYDQHPLDTGFSQKIGEVSSCYKDEPIEAVVSEIVKQGEWSHMIIIQDRERSSISKKLRWVKQTIMGCEVERLFLVQILSSIRPKEDFVNVVVNCPVEVTIQILQLVAEESSHSTLELVRFNWILLRMQLKHFTHYNRFLRNGDNLAMTITNISKYPFEEYILKLLRGEKICSVKVLVYRCMSNCYQMEMPVYVGQYCSGDEVARNTDVIMPAHFQQFYGQHLKIAYKEYVHFLYEVKDRESASHFAGVDKELMDVLSETCNFSYTLVPSVDGSWGALENGTWNGMIGMVARGEADMAIGAITIIALREEVIDFTVPYHEHSNTVILLVHAERWNFICNVFTMRVWIIIGSLPLIMSLVYLYIVYMSTEPSYRHCWRHNLASVIFISTGNLLYQGNFLRDEKLSIQGVDVRGILRIIWSFYWLAIIILVATYSGNLTSLLAVTKAKLPFTTLKGLANDKRYTLLIQPNSSTQILFQTSKSGIYKELWEKIKNNLDKSFVKSDDEALKRLENEQNLAYTASDTGIKQYRSEKMCKERVLLSEGYFKSGFGIVLHQGAPYKRRFNTIIMRIVSAGIIDRWENIHGNHEPCPGATRTEISNQPISIEDMFYMFVVLAFGLLASFVSLFIEMISKR